MFILLKTKTKDKSFGSGSKSRFILSLDFTLCFMLNLSVVSSYSLVSVLALVIAGLTIEVRSCIPFFTISETNSTEFVVLGCSAQ